MKRITINVHLSYYYREFSLNYTKIALYALFGLLGLFAIQLSAGYLIMKKYEACAAEWRAAHPGKLSPDAMRGMIVGAVDCVEGRLNVFERFFFDADAARQRAEALKPAVAAPSAP